MKITKSRRRRGGKLNLPAELGGAGGGARGRLETFQEEHEDPGQGQDGEWTDSRALGTASPTRMVS